MAATTAAVPAWLKLRDGALIRRLAAARHHPRAGQQAEGQAAGRRPGSSCSSSSTPASVCKSLVEYLKAFDITLSVMQTEEALYRVAYELAEDARARERALHGGALRADAAHAARASS